MKLKEYSDKSFCICGDNTKEYKEELKTLGGRWNSNLKEGPGWIFSNKNKVKVQEWLSKISVCEHIYDEEQQVCTECGIKLTIKDSSIIFDRCISSFKVQVSIFFVLYNSKSSKNFPFR